jgi:hypothetical protein
MPLHRQSAAPGTLYPADSEDFKSGSRQWREWSVRCNIKDRTQNQVFGKYLGEGTRQNGEQKKLLPFKFFLIFPIHTLQLRAFADEAVQRPNV